MYIYIHLKIKPNSVRIRFQSCHIFVLPSTGFELTPLIHCSTIRLTLRPAPQTTRPHPLQYMFLCIYIYGSKQKYKYLYSTSYPNPYLTGSCTVTDINNKYHDTLSRLYSLLLNKLLKHDLKLIKTPSQNQISAFSLFFWLEQEQRSNFNLLEQSWLFTRQYIF